MLEAGAVAYTNIPNWGVSVWSDCGYPWIREEVEVYINKNYAVVAERAYYYQVHYAKKQHFVNGEVNLTYQRDNQPTHDWLDKETYFLNSGALSPGGPSYTVEQLPCGALRVHVQIDVASRAARDRYAAQQRKEALSLARSNSGEDIPVQLTFARPLAIDELHTLAQDADLALELIIFEARDPNQEQHTVAARGAGTGLADPDSLKLGLDMRNLQLVGVTVARGIVPASSTGLEKLATDERVYIPDVTPYLLATEVATQRGVEVGQVQVSVPTPHWYISAERANASLP